ncbi:MAG: hypothetical protein DRJ43_02020 [Thermoprotei archaeon]|nr:MAG: hypothetical protein DRJ43_02020 [Thermoprotei archaeon]
MGRRFLYATLLLVASLVAVVHYLLYYPRYARVEPGMGDLGEAFTRLYEADGEFRKTVEELRSMVLDPEKPYDRGRALELFNTLLRKLHLPPIPPHLFNYEKSVREKAALVPEGILCRVPRELNLTVVQPLLDVEEGNALEAVYLCSFEHGGGEVVEVTLIFSDEDRPPANSADDLWYDVWRLVAWGRVEDVETFYVVPSDSRVLVRYSGLVLVMGGTLGLREVAPIGSGARAYGESAHLEVVEVAESMDITVYVNTWNHALSLRDCNPGVEKALFTLDEVRVAVGSRMDAENQYSDLAYVSEIVLLPPG